MLKEENVLTEKKYINKFTGLAIVLIFIIFKEITTLIMCKEM